jgi:hypothetical protein
MWFAHDYMPCESDSLLCPIIFPVVEHVVVVVVVVWVERGGVVANPCATHRRAVGRGGGRIFLSFNG